ncbi:MAG: DegT/DnrJ/EryC1/StrS family aminotransferase [Candidatus Omnitrophota bacterium]
MNIPLLDLKKEYAYIKKDVDKQLKGCLQAQHWILGEKVAEFEKETAKYLGVQYAVGVASGTDALILALSALSLKLKGKECFDKKDEVITSHFTFIATAEAIARSGATPVFVDINQDTFNIDPVQIKKAITKNTVGIIPVHLYGQACDMAEISKITKENNLFMLEDTAQAFGACYKDKKLGTIGDLGAFSFFPSKNLGCYGDGGLVAGNSKELAESIKILRVHGQVQQYQADYLGVNSRLDAIQAAILLAKLKHIDKFNQLRIKTAEKYNNALKDIKQIQTPKLSSIEHRASSISHVYHLYTIKVSQKRDELLKYLNSQGIAARIYYPVLLNKMKVFRSAKKGSLKSAEKASSEILSLPIHPFLQDSQIKYIAKNISSFFSGHYNQK